MVMIVIYHILSTYIIKHKETILIMSALKNYKFLVSLMLLSGNLPTWAEIKSEGWGLVIWNY